MLFRKICNSRTIDGYKDTNPSLFSTSSKAVMKSNFHRPSEAFTEGKIYCFGSIDPLLGLLVLLLYRVKYLLLRRVVSVTFRCVIALCIDDAAK